MTLLKPAEKRGSIFQNPVPTAIGGLKLMFKILPQYLTNRAEVEPKVKPGPFLTDTSLYAVEPASGLRITWFGHSASLVEIDGMRVLIDPVWDERASPVSWAGPKRFFPPTLALAELPRIDVVLLSHDHYDHFGSETIKSLAKLANTQSALWVTSLGVGQRLQARGVPAARIAELDWTHSVEASNASGARLKITAWPARHFSGRGVLDRFKTLWSSFVLEGAQHKVYFGADTGWWEGFAEVAAQYDRFDLTMLEIGAYHPLWADIHLGPDAATRAYLALGGPAKAGLLMPIHWGLFNLALHAWRQPMERMLELAEEQNLPLWSPLPGEPTEVTGQSVLSSWWQRR